MSTKKTELQGISSSGGPSLDKTQHNGIDIAKITLNIMESYKFYFTMTWVGKWTLCHVYLRFWKFMMRRQMSQLSQIKEYDGEML